jgi:hypothetical protein
MAVSRADTSTLGRWWWTIDRWTLAALLALVGFGYVMMLAASPAVAERIGASSRNMFFVRQIVYLAAATALMVAVSMLSVRQVRLLGWVGLGVSLLMVAATLVMGVEIKGARRWLSLPALGSVPVRLRGGCALGHAARGAAPDPERGSVGERGRGATPARSSARSARAALRASRERGGAAARGSRRRACTRAPVPLQAGGRAQAPRGRGAQRAHL